jgi:hypothetical protein
MENGNGSGSGDGAFADRTLDTGGASNVPARSGDVAEASRDPLAYRDGHVNIERRARAVERWVIDHGYGGSVERFDRDAGLDFDAA